MKHPIVKAALFLLLALLAGCVAAGQLNAFLGITFSAKPLPDETTARPVVAATGGGAIDPVTAVILPAGSTIVITRCPLASAPGSTSATSSTGWSWARS